MDATDECPSFEGDALGTQYDNISFTASLQSSPSSSSFSSSEACDDVSYSTLESREDCFLPEAHKHCGFRTHFTNPKVTRAAKMAADAIASQKPTGEEDNPTDCMKLVYELKYGGGGVVDG